MKIEHKICIKDPYEKIPLGRFFEYKEYLETTKKHFDKIFVECHLPGSNWKVGTVKENLSECIESIDELILEIGDSRYTTFDVIESIKKQVIAKKLSDIRSNVNDDGKELVVTQNKKSTVKKEVTSSQ